MIEDEVDHRLGNTLAFDVALRHWADVLSLATGCPVERDRFQTSAAAGIWAAISARACAIP
jgi:hypothetical protein